MQLLPGRTITGMSAILLPHLDPNTVDWASLDAHIARTQEAGLTPAVNMDTGYVQLLDADTRVRVLDRAAAITGGDFVAGAFTADEREAVFDLDAYCRAAEEITTRGGLPVVFPSHGLNDYGDSAWLDAHGHLASHLDRFLGFELGPMFVPYGRIVSLDTYRDLLEIPQCIGAKHSSLDRGLEWDRLALRGRGAPRFHGADRQRPGHRHGDVRLRLPAGPLDVRPGQVRRAGPHVGSGRPRVLPTQRRSPVPGPPHVPPAGARLSPQRGDVPPDAGLGRERRRSPRRPPPAPTATARSCALSAVNSESSSAPLDAGEEADQHRKAPRPSLQPWRGDLDGRRGRPRGSPGPVDDHYRRLSRLQDRAQPLGGAAHGGLGRRGRRAAVRSGPPPMGPVRGQRGRTGVGRGHRGATRRTGQPPPAGARRDHC